MRLHHLSVTAFGPFPDTVEVDFDTLSDAGLFLLTGPTGGGKSSVLDAICFALYGQVPGDRATAKRLRSDQAPPGRSPEVTLECTVAGRRFRVVRSPAWRRPRKRGEGTTPQQASVTVTEQVDGAWVHHTSRLDEAGDLLGGVLGMGLTQFTQVALLPQGRFQAFLRASSEERHKLLQRLFQAHRFEHVERWLRERRLATGRESERLHGLVTHLLHRVAEASGATLPEDVDAVAWTAHVSAEAEGNRSRAVAALESAARAAAAASQRALELRTLTEQQARYAGAATAWQTLAEREPDHRQDTASLAAGRRAAAVRPLLDLATSARDEAAEATRIASARLDAVAADAASPFTQDLDLAALLSLEHAARDRSAALLEAAGRQLAVEQEQRELAGSDREIAGERRRLDDLQRARSELPAAIATARDQLASSVTAGGELAAARHTLAEAATKRESAARVVALRAESVTADDELRVAVDRSQAATQRWLDIQERRLTGLAAELAVTLAVGASCPVCGSDDHPHPARAVPGTPDLGAEKAARREVDDADVERHAREGHVRDLATRLAIAVEASGGLSVADAEQAWSAAAARVESLSALAETAEACQARVARLERELGDLDHRDLALRTDLVARESALATRRHAVDKIQQELEVLLAGDPWQLAGPAPVEPDARAARWRVTADLCREAAEALRARESLDRAAARAAQHAQQAADEAGFDGPDAALAASLAPSDLEALAERVAAHTSALTATRAVLDNPVLVTASEQPAPDLHSALAAEVVADHAWRDAQSVHDRASSAAQRLARLAAEVVEATSAWAPVRDEHEQVAALAAFVDGRSPDNRLQMRLSAYVLGYRLGQVVAASNGRLHHMSDGRYTLVHTARRAAGETRGGLSLSVRDDWSGEERDPATLSGGEMFVVSLALALGLADVISHEAGGTELDSLFVDEGFGSLDADTLEDVMAMLDSLRDGGRVVGVVSHVAEMRDRIPTQLRVHKSPTGSTLRLYRG